jgi:hypothetical protein
VSSSLKVHKELYTKASVVAEVVVVVEEEAAAEEEEEEGVVAMAVGMAA